MAKKFDIRRYTSEAEDTSTAKITGKAKKSADYLNAIIKNGKKK